MRRHGLEMVEGSPYNFESFYGVRNSWSAGEHDIEPFVVIERYHLLIDAIKCRVLSVGGKNVSYYQKTALKKLAMRSADSR